MGVHVRWIADGAGAGGEGEGEGSGEGEEGEGGVEVRLVFQAVIDPVRYSPSGKRGTPF